MVMEQFNCTSNWLLAQFLYFYLFYSFLYKLSVPTSAPIGLDVVSQSSTSVTVSWSPPQSERQNGIISRYSVNVTKSNSGESSLLSTADRSITLEQLDPFTTYLISVAAQTAIGLGPYTLPLTVTTNEDGNDLCM